ncbi:NAD-dependent epimerase/dehydratase family protein [Blautia sp.]|jgi:UDP-2-acetamido-2,6-beta-L-arabino-hexul-4-ose reductase|uniref:NAD-dependent epimerase/dehydratase family protein n=1 Tax=Blautia sp. TaxID=1955243 RepID=UPI003D946E08
MKKILITGYTGFLGTNLIDKLKRIAEDYVVYGINSSTPMIRIEDYAKDCDFVFNFAAVHRPKKKEEFDEVNAQLFLYVIECLEKNKNNCPVLYTSSIQAKDDSDYGRSKIHGENILRKHTEKSGSRGIVYRLTNTFGPYARPNGHSVVATFCNNIAKGLPITISDPRHVMHLQYVGDVIEDFVKRLNEGREGMFEFHEIPSQYTYDISLQEIADYLYAFEDELKNNKTPVGKTEFEQKLLATYIYYREQVS